MKGGLRSACLTMVVFLVGCGADGALRLPVSEFTAEHAQLYEDGVDFVHDPRALSGRWRMNWERELHDRVRWADFIGVVRVSNILVEVDPEQHTSYRLRTQVEQPLLGEAPNELELPSAYGQAGVDSVARNQQRLLNARLVAYVKWYRNDLGEIAAHWHLAPASRPVLRRTSHWLERVRGVDSLPGATRIQRTVRAR
ncbi:MAG: hypothetical protein MJD61_01015 [Proteobacteria bacterium]|nr:hypothetical protein [Pseudomonadota bacterium]